MEKLRFKEDNNRKQKVLREICDIKTGKLNANAMSANGKYRFYTCAKNYYYTDEYAFDSEALLISGNGANVGYIHHYIGKFNAYQRTYVLQNFKIDVPYLKQYLNQKLKYRIFSEKKNGNTPYITLSTLSEMLIKIPSVEEQCKIGSFLSLLDSKVSNVNKKIEQLQLLKKGYLQKMFPKKGENTPEIRFNGFTEAWEQRKLGEFCEMFNGDRGINYPNDKDMVSVGIPFINAGDIKNGRVDLRSSNKITREKYSQLGGAKLQLGDIVYCLRGTLGKNAFIDNFEEGTVASSLVALRPKNIDGKYLFHILNSDIELRQRTVNDEGAAQPNLSAKNLSEFYIPVSKLEEQAKISCYLDRLDNLITLHQRKHELLTKLKQGYMQRLFSE